ncbi:MAG TPA: bifunctional DNA-binding transcriptional regulator/O6-methylguanine-DNA methyltransferase Ada [Terriglobales bacterium]|nr:bifunctional DNA-binding transcriptional regulator/O6-methylguanine-DNA methyltransferase Ada [Terriglobales bacterium]
MQTELQSKWQQVMTRDARQDGRFVFAVRTTGIYCRPSCPSRRPRRESVEFFPNPGEAERAGYRACLRCQPTQISAQAQYVARARQLLDNVEGVLTLGELSRRVGLSPFHLQRLFKRATGLSPREYQAARRVQQVKAGLRNGNDVTTALYDAGYGSPSRLYETSAQQLGMTPGEYRRGGAGASITFAIAPTALGRLLVAATQRGLCAVRFGENAAELERDLREEFHAAELHRDDAAMKRYLDPLLATIRGEDITVDLPLDVRATAFQQKVWEKLRQIPRGETRSYGEIARQIGDPKAVRAVARACATNPVAIVVPCHRVVRGDGKESGYRWGLERKKKLLDREHSSQQTA